MSKPWVADDPCPEYSRLDRIGGVPPRPEPLAEGDTVRVVRQHLPGVPNGAYTGVVEKIDNPLRNPYAYLVRHHRHDPDWPRESCTRDQLVKVDPADVERELAEHDARTDGAR